MLCAVKQSTQYNNTAFDSQRQSEAFPRLRSGSSDGNTVWQWGHKLLGIQFRTVLYVWMHGIPVLYQCVQGIPHAVLLLLLLVVVISEYPKEC